MRLSDFGHADPKRRKSTDPLPDAGEASKNGQPGRCAQPAPKTGGGPQEPGAVIRPAPEHDFPAASGSRDAGDGKLWTVNETARACGLAPSTWRDWIDGMLLIAPRHEDQGNRRNGLCYSSAQVAALKSILITHQVVIETKHGLRRTRKQPDQLCVSAQITEFNRLYESEVHPEDIQPGGVRLIREVETWVSPAGEQVIRQPAETGEQQPFSSIPDFRTWRPATVQPPGHRSRRRTRPR